ncbi:type II toxin-antitoxin system HicA family toxin [Archaeoglobus profundus]|uniref:YcfA family protein n=1 Tax=Archaeoglobus profundus (strain DSM 5631 / JCM 9629 / NBRC 100127 / Av18) TaxID=572546 RepID=D2RF46_ARCPA|nr:type II toxin-antitoxin system HicA family toxin [Archaeoglobus profundus]ADB58740.1 YcfA family protein [Archaeoglobus profundus DSM 5631]
MSKIYKASDIRRALNKKGFREVGSKHIKYILYIDEKKQPIFTIISHSAKDLSKEIQKRIMKQLKFKSRKDFEDFIECPMSRDDYIRYLKKEGYI